MDNKDVVYGIYVMEYCSVIKILSFVTTQIDLENIMLSEISQTEKDNFFMISHMWNVNKTKQNKSNSLIQGTNGQLTEGG